MKIRTRSTRGVASGLVTTVWAALSGLTFGASAQLPPDQLNMSATTPITPNTPPLNMLLDDHLFIGVGPAPTGFTFPGIYGALQLDPSLIFVLPGRTGFGSELVQFGSAIPSSSPLHVQVLSETELGIQFSERLPVGPAPNFGQEQSEAECRARALAALNDFIGANLAPGWASGAVLGQATPLYRPDFTTPAYYHYDVSAGGHIVVSTGGHDAPLSHWIDTGPSLVAQLQQEAQAAGQVISRYWRLDVTSWVGEDAAGNVVASIGQPPPRLLPDGSGGYAFAEWSSFAQLKAEYAQTYHAMLEAEAMRVAGLWAIERNGNDGPWSSWTINWATGGPAAQCFYDQFDYDGCKVGCGPIAWAMLFGWADRLAGIGDPTWANRWGIFRENAGYGADAIAPPRMTTDVETMASEIHEHVGTFCAFGQGATAPWDMHRADRYLSGRTWASIDTFYDGAGIHRNGLFARARDEILSGKAVVIGTGWLNHYPVAHGFMTRYRDESFLAWSWRERENKFFLNLGDSGRGNGWTNTGTWFCGRIHAN